MTNKEAIKLIQEIGEDGRNVNAEQIEALNLAIRALHDIDNAPDVFYLCDHTACIKGETFGAHACDPCGYMRKIRHAANFDPLYDNDGRVMAYYERAQTDVEPKLSDKQIEEITDLLENEWGYEGMKEDVTRLLRGAAND